MARGLFRRTIQCRGIHFVLELRNEEQIMSQDSNVREVLQSEAGQVQPRHGVFGDFISFNAVAISKGKRSTRTFVRLV
jgi:hypothetical protein